MIQTDIGRGKTDVREVPPQTWAWTIIVGLLAFLAMLAMSGCTSPCTCASPKPAVETAKTATNVGLGGACARCGWAPPTQYLGNGCYSTAAVGHFHADDPPHGWPTAGSPSRPWQPGDWQPGYSIGGSKVASTTSGAIEFPGSGR